ncbi:MAG: sigma-70 family RNA polymerase sigma factor [Pirellulaceae bacterium]|nr:sigma-70 family RNA polymerase sigma factor [Pirellulaceae bacterium]
MEDVHRIQQWLSEAQAGSNDALGQALEACRAYLLLVAERELDPALRAKGGASDIVQETFIEAQRAFSRFSSTSHDQFLAWLRAMLLNNVTDFRRKYRGTQKRNSDREVALDAGPSSSDWRSRLASDAPTASGEFTQQETLLEIQAALEQLPEDYRLVIAYRYEENCSFEEIALRMQRTPNAVQKLFARAIDRLQAMIEREL